MTPIFEQKNKVLKNNTSLFRGGEGKGPINSFWSLQSPSESKPDSGRWLERAYYCWVSPSPFCPSHNTSFYRCDIFILSVSTGRVKAFRLHTCNSFPVYKIFLQFQHNTDKYRCLKNMPLILKRSTVSKEHFILQNWSQTALCKCLAWISDPLLAQIYTGTLLIASARLLQNNLQSLWNMSTA